MYVIGNNDDGELGMNHLHNIKKLTKHGKHWIKNIFCGFYFNIFIDDNNNYWSAGNNEYGSCGIGKKYKTITKLSEIMYFKKIK